MAERGGVFSTAKEGRRPRKKEERGNCPEEKRRQIVGRRRRLISHLVTSPARSLQLCIYLAISQRQDEFFGEILTGYYWFDITIRDTISELSCKTNFVTQRPLNYLAKHLRRRMPNAHRAPEPELCSVGNRSDLTF